MIDPELKIQLDSISENLTQINKKSGKTGIWRSFFNGVFGALGYVAGLAIIVVVLGWVLQKTGQLPAFEAQVKNFTNLVSAAQKLIINDSSSSSNSANANQPAGGGQSVIINGQQYRVNVSQ